MLFRGLQIVQIVPEAPSRIILRPESRLCYTRTTMSAKTGLGMSGSGRPFDADRKARYVELLALYGRPQQAADETGVHRNTVQKHRKDDPDFAEAIEVALDRYREMLVEEAHRRAVEGTEKPVYWAGQRCGSIREYSDKLLLVLLRRHIPEFREKLDVNQRTHVTGGVSHLRDLEADLRGLSPASREKLKEVMAEITERDTADE